MIKKKVGVVRKDKESFESSQVNETKALAFTALLCWFWPQ